LLNSGFTKGETIDFEKATNDDELFAMVRKQLLIPDKRIYLNTGSLGPSPLEIIDGMHAITRQLESNPVGENWGRWVTKWN
jgi:hypothetical protein